MKQYVALKIPDVHNMYEAFLKASIPSSEPYNKALLKLSYYISYNMNIPFSPSFNPDDYLQNILINNKPVQ
jgi:hypothetical protein